jgi:molybdenum cofactor synthesis domain-containing protein
MSNIVTACMIIIGNEILSGRTQDKNLSWLAGRLNEVGIRMRHARVIPDVEEIIVATINEVRARYDYVFTSGGIGPTHDDITSACIAKAFGVPFGRNAEAERRLHAYYNSNNMELNEARLRMADIPEGATLIDNPVSTAPGFIMENVYVLAGVPRIMQAMMDGIIHSLNGGTSVLSETLSFWLPEGTIAEGVSKIQDQFPEVEIGSYPMIKDDKLATSLVLRSDDVALLQTATDATRAFINSLNGKWIEQ